MPRKRWVKSATASRIVACRNCRKARIKCKVLEDGKSCGTCLEKRLACGGSVYTDEKLKRLYRHQVKYEDKEIQVPEPKAVNNPIDQSNTAIPAYDEQNLSRSNNPILTQRELSGEFHLRNGGHRGKEHAVFQGSVAEPTRAFKSWPAQHDPFIIHNLPHYQTSQEDDQGDFVQGSSTGTSTTNFEVSAMFEFLQNGYSGLR